MCGVGTDVSSFVVTFDKKRKLPMNCQVTSDAFLHDFTVETHHVSVITSPIQVVVSVNELSVLRV